MGEVWARIVEFPNYAVSDLGRVMRLTDNTSGKAGTILGQRRTCWDYFEVALCPGERHRSVHRLVAIHHVPNPDGKPQVNHCDGVKTNNRATNLQWVTASENIQHALRTGLKIPLKGSQHGCAKL